MRPEITMYTMPFCPNCAQAKQFLSEKGISFTEKSVLIPKYFRERLKLYNGPGGPLTVVGDRILLRFSLEEFQEVFKDF